ncbi:MAG: ABC-F family ATP-binding cassette domain-containing protein [Phycisphaerales bacterium]|nr:ABC-F family ATP-binding cassette domain-containing protein [Phycisphaerales bacterium]
MPPSPPALSARELSKHFGPRTLFTSVSLTIDPSERLGLIGPNGSGKSTLLKILAGLEHHDEGHITYRKNLRTAYVPQADTFPADSTILSTVIAALTANPPSHLHDEHEITLHAEQTLYRVGFSDLTRPTNILSGGQRKRLAIARALALEPDLLMLDEPTNHLDLESITWLESLLRSSPFASVFITHDRFFLQAVATRVVELSTAYPQGTFSAEGDYETFLERKDAFLEGQLRQQQALAGQVKEDLRWLARGAKARRTKSKSRIHASMQRIDELAAMKLRTAPPRAAAIDFLSSDRKTQKLLVARGVSASIPTAPLFRDVDIILSPGTRLGLMGPNGSGKSTLLRVLTLQQPSDPPSPEAIAYAASIAHELPRSAPPLATVQHAPGLRIVYFSQHRAELDPNLTLAEALAPQNIVIYQGRQLHVAGYAQMFLFTKDQLDSPLSTLSGGELARVHLARLMLEPADVLILDEPTNDLDIPTLEVLEESLEEFAGALVLVTHDRAMLDRLANKILYLEGNATGQAHFYADYQQFLAVQTAKPAAAAPAPTSTATSSESTTTTTATQTKKKLTYKQQRELTDIEAEMPRLDERIKHLQTQMNDPAVLSDRKKLDTICREITEAQTRSDQLLERWAELESLKD